jgi:hypothetical protein
VSRKRRRKQREEPARDARAVTPAASHAAPEPEPAPARTMDAATLRHLQRSAGNQAVARRLGGSPLPSPVRSRMESAFGRSFAGVRVHEGETGDRIAARTGAPAATTGEDIYFRSGEFAPHTPVGEALLAHELAHIAGAHTDAAEAGELEPVVSPRLEAEANRTAFAAMARLFLGIRTGAAGEHGPRTTRARRAGLLPGSCFSSSTIEAPSYLGPHSRETLNRLNDRLGSLDLLGPVIALGTAGTVGFGRPSDPSDTVEAAALALRGLPAIKRAVITEEVTLLLVRHENDMNERERQFWRRILEEL